MADPRPPRDGLGQLADEIARLSARLDALESPSGTQQYNAVPELQVAVELLQAQQAALAEQQATITAQQEVIVDLVDGLDARVTTFIDENIDDIVAAQVTAALAGADITIGQTGGVVRMPSILTTGVGSATGRVAVWAAGDGRVGNTA